jgi:hypothetical protein
MIELLLLAAAGPSAAEIARLETSAVAAGKTVYTHREGVQYALGPRVEARNVSCTQESRGRFSCTFESRQSNGPYKTDFGAWTPRRETLVRDGLGGWRIEPAKAGP